MVSTYFHLTKNMEGPTNVGGMWALISIALIGIVGGLVISIAICMAIKKA
jgi:hypothetical protein